jgi:hypothetical protein
VNDLSMMNKATAVCYSGHLSDEVLARFEGSGIGSEVAGRKQVEEPIQRELSFAVSHRKGSSTVRMQWAAPQCPPQEVGR